MRSDMVPAAIFPDYGLTGHSANIENSPSCREIIRWFPSLARAASGQQGHKPFFHPYSKTQVQILGEQDWKQTRRSLCSTAPLSSVSENATNKSGMPVSTTALNLMFVLMRSRISCIASSGKAEISKLS